MYEAAGPVEDGESQSALEPELQCRGWGSGDGITVANVDAIDIVIKGGTTAHDAMWMRLVLCHLNHRLDLLHRRNVNSTEHESIQPSDSDSQEGPAQVSDPIDPMQICQVHQEDESITHLSWSCKANEPQDVTYSMELAL
jgi:hypothetical protein